MCVMCCRHIQDIAKMGQNKAKTQDPTPDEGC